MKRCVTCFLFLSLFFTVRAQTVGNLKLPQNYHGRLDVIIEKMGTDMKVRFVIDKEELSRFNTSLTTYEEKNINGVLKMLSDSWGMVSAINPDGYIYIAKDPESLARLMSGRVEQTVEVKAEKQAERSKLEPIRRNFTLTGSVSDVNSGEKMPYATVRVVGGVGGVTTDANGRFTLHKVPCDTVTVEVAYIGYQKRYVELEPSAKNDPIGVDLEPQKQEIAEVFVFGRKDDKALEQYVDEQKIKMAPAALKFLPNIGEKDIMRSFQLMPGISASNENSSGMYVRGGTPDQNLILYDGFTVYYVDHLHGFYSAFNSNALKDVQLYKGGFESKFGGRLSSVTEITGKDGNAKKLAGGAELSLLSVNAYIEAPIGDKFTSLFAFRRSYQGWLYKKISGQNSNQSEGTTVSRRMGPGGESDPKSYFYDLNAKLTYNPTYKDVISLSVFNGTDYVDNTPSFSMPGGGGGMGGGMGGGGFMSMNMDNSDYSRYGNVGTSLRWSRKWNEKLTSTTLASFSNFYSTRDESRSITYTDDDDVTQTVKSGVMEDNNLKDFTLSNAWKLALTDKHTLEFGANATYYDIDYSYAQSDTATLVSKVDNAVMAGVYLQDKMRLAGGKLFVTPGLRATWFSNTGKFYAEPRLSASYALAPKVKVNAATGLYYQFANRVVREDIMSGNSDFWILSNDKDIPVSSSRHLNLGINYDLPDFLFSVEGYYKKNKDISEYTLRFQRKLSGMGGGMGGGGNGGAVESVEQFFTGDGYATGVEFLAQKKAGKLSGWISYTLGEVKNRFPDQSDKYFFAYQDVTHELKMVGVYKFGNFDFSATWIFSTGRPYTAPLGGYTITLVDGSTESYYAVSDKNTYRLPDYHRLDLAASFRFDMLGTRGKSSSVGVSLFNAYNRKNVSAKKFQIVDGTILESNINYLSITPNVTLSVKF